jgi:PAS domain S-box-containing protein
MENILTDKEIVDLFTHFSDTEKNFIQKVVKALPDVLYVMNLDNKTIIYSSRLIALEIGYSVKDVEEMSHPIFDVIHPADRDRFLKHLEEVRSSFDQKVHGIEYRLIKRDGKIAWFSDRNTVFTKDVNGIPHTKIGIVHEITEQKEYEQRLLRKEKIIEQTEALAGTGSWEYDVSSKEFIWSAGMYSLFEMPAGVPVQPSVYLDYCIPSERPIADKIVNAIKDGQNAFDETLHIRSNGGVKSLKIKAEPLQRSNGKYDKIIGTDLDVSVIAKKQDELMALNDALYRMNRDVVSLHTDLKTFSQLTATEYQANLKNIYTSFEMIVIQDAGKLSNSSKALVRKIQSSLQRMNLLTSDIEAYLNISLQESKKEQVDLDRLLLTIVADLQQRILVDDLTINKGEIGTVVGSSNLINILFHKLLDNAIKFRKNDGKIVINISSAVNELAAAKVLAVSIEDNGIGIDASETEKVFELFYKNHYNKKLKGSGVGLAIARKIMELHNGYIDIGPGTNEKGTRVTCYFPLQ